MRILKIFLFFVVLILFGIAFIMQPPSSPIPLPPLLLPIYTDKQIPGNDYINTIFNN
jgi:hypothetical protein